MSEAVLEPESRAVADAFRIAAGRALLPDAVFAEHAASLAAIEGERRKLIAAELVALALRFQRLGGEAGAIAVHQLSVLAALLLHDPGSQTSAHDLSALQHLLGGTLAPLLARDVTDTPDPNASPLAIQISKSASLGGSRPLGHETKTRSPPSSGSLARRRMRLGRHANGRVAFGGKADRSREPS